MSTAAARDAQRKLLQRSPVSATVAILFKGTAALVSALVVSIVIEWIGMATLWRAQGVHHSRQMLEQHWAYLAADFSEPVARVAPLAVATSTLDTLTAAAAVPVEALEKAMAWTLEGDLMYEAGLPLTTVWSLLWQGLEAGINILQVFAIRLLLVALTAPRLIVYSLFALVAGLTLTDIRRARGGREYSFRYHHIKTWMTPSLTVWALAYLAFPGNVHPNVFLVPMIWAFSGTLFFLAATFKKYT